MKNYRRLIALVLVISAFCSISIFANTVTRLSINGTIAEIPPSISMREGLIPLKWVAERMGASDVSWNKGTVTVEIPSFLAMHQYVSYLNGLKSEKEGAYSLPARLQSLDFPTAEFKSYHPTIKQKPLTLNITSGDFSMPWALYDYKVIKGTLFVDYRWLNTLFLADTKYDETANTLMISYMTSKELDENIDKLEEVIKPITAEEALALWIRGQQTRSGALQYIALSPNLKQEAIANVNTQGWVTGGSSPSLGKADVLETEKVDDKTISYVVQYDEMLSGQVYNQFKQRIAIQKQADLNQENWMIINVTDNNPDYSVLINEK